MVISASDPVTSLERRLGPLDGAAIIVSNVIGGTILFAPPFMAGLVPNSWLYLGLWVAGGALAFAGPWRTRSSPRSAQEPAANTCIWMRRMVAWRRF
jgi:hypothetical protein